jgi:hypothetical protein
MSDADLQKQTVTPQEFRHIAAMARWQPKTIDLFLRRPYAKDFVAIGEDGVNRRLVKVQD